MYTTYNLCSGRDEKYVCKEYVFEKCNGFQRKHYIQDVSKIMQKWIKYITWKLFSLKQHGLPESQKIIETSFQ